jgi:isochorismate hydrolase
LLKERRLVRRSEPYFTNENSSKKTTEWKSKIASSTRQRKNLVLNPSKSALIIIDMINFFAHDHGSAYIKSSPPVIENINLLTSLFRKNSAPIIYTRHCHKDETELGMMGKFYKGFIKCGTGEDEIIDKLKPSPKDKIFTKNSYDAFLNTGLQKWLEDENISQVVITGLLTHLCCETTARSAFVRGFEVYLPIDATASSKEIFHLGSIVGLADGVAVTLETKEVIELCSKLP